MQSHLRVFTCITSLFACFASIGPTYGIDLKQREREFQAKIAPLLREHCYGCHEGEEPEAGLGLHHFKNAQSMLKERSTWHMVRQRVQIGDMPPPDASDLSDADRDLLVKWLNEFLDDVDCGATPNPGAVTLRRLNRLEYENTIKNLLGVEYHPARDFPGDDVGYGFDNIGDVLTLPPLLMEKYVKAAEEISKTAIKAPEPGAVFESSYSGSQLSGDGNKSSIRTLASSGEAILEEQIPWTGIYEVEFELSGDQAGSEPAKASIHIDEKQIRVISVPNDRKDPQVFPIKLRLRAGKRSIRVRFENDFYRAAEGGQPQQDRNLHIHNISVFGIEAPEPLDPNSLPPSHKYLISVVPDRLISAENATSKVLQPIASRAFRRPVTSDELERLVQLALSAQEAGESFEGSIQLAIQAILISPHFLFRVELPGENESSDAYPLVGDYQLATRISYFLWSTMPDNRLFQLAAEGKLRDREVLRAEVKRMIANRKANAFVENFAGQWLTLRKLDEFQPNTGLFPQWNESIKELVRRETYTFFAGVMREDQSILTLLDADFTYLNEELAKFYGIDDVHGEHFRKVSTTSQPRRGLLTQASILAVTSNPTRTSPVKRGKWILENILNEPPPPPPPNVPELEKAELAGTVRQKMEQHRANPACANCHQLMDPLGLALENFNAIGLWRTEDGGEKIDSSGVLPSGKSVRHAGDLIRTLRADDADRFARCLAEKMLTFAVGRGMEYYDRCAVDKIVAEIRNDDYRFSSLVTEIIASDPFQKLGERQ